MPPSMDTEPFAECLRYLQIISLLFDRILALPKASTRALASLGKWQVGAVCRLWYKLCARTA